MMMASKEELAELTSQVEDLIFIVHTLSGAIERLKEQNEALDEKVRDLEAKMQRHEEYVVSRFQGLAHTLVAQTETCE